MGRLGGFSYREVTQRLRVLGFELARQGRGSHEQWRHPTTLKIAVVPRHNRDVPEGTLRSIFNGAAFDVEEFLKA